MPSTLSESKREQLLAQLDDLSATELFDMLNDDTQNKLRIEFSESLDLGDVEELLFNVIDYNAERLSDLSLRFDGNW